MQRYSEKIVNQVRKIRKEEGLSFKELEKRFKIPATTIHNWCAGIGTRESTILLLNERKRSLFINSEKYIVPEKLNKKEAKFIAGVLYGCEGSKYPATRGVAFCNSDPNLILSFLNLLKKSFNLKEEKFSVHLQIHTTHNYQEVREKWSRFLGIPVTKFIKPTIKVPKGGKHRQNYQGTCTLRYRDYSVQLKLQGIFSKFLQNFSSEY